MEMANCKTPVAKIRSCNYLTCQRPPNGTSQNAKDSCYFIGTNENAVKWQIWTGLLLHLLLYYFKFLSAWKKSFSRLVGLAKTGVWMFEDFVEVLKVYGIAGPPQRPQPHVIEQYLKGFEPNTSVPMG